MGRIEHAPLDGGRASTPTDLSPSPAAPPYHWKLRMFQSRPGRVQALWDKVPTCRPRLTRWQALAHHEKVVVMDQQHENLQELLTRLNNIRDSMEVALDDIRGIEDDYRRGLLEAHITGAIREINAQIAELVSSH